MRLLLTADAVGGVWRYAVDLAAALAPLGVETVLAVLGPVPAGLDLPTRTLVTGLPLDWLADGPGAVRAAAARLAALAGAVGADLAQVNSPALAAAAWPCPVVAAAHGCVATWWDAAHAAPLPADLAWHPPLVREGLLAAAATVAPSAAYAETVRRRYTLPAAPLAVHNGRALPPAPADGAARHALTVGRLWDRVKRTDLLDQVADRLPFPVHAAGAAVAPHGEAAAPRHLRLLGTLPDAALAAEYAARPVFVAAPSFEPFGLAVLEAAGHGCAPVLSNLATFRELWDGAALFVAGDDADAWAAAVAGLVADPARRAALGAAARARAARYTIAATAAAMAALYRRLLAGDRAAA